MFEQNVFFWNLTAVPYVTHLGFSNGPNFVYLGQGSLKILQWLLLRVLIDPTDIVMDNVILNIVLCFSGEEGGQILQQLFEGPSPSSTSGESSKQICWRLCRNNPAFVAAWNRGTRTFWTRRVRRRVSSLTLTEMPESDNSSMFFIFFFSHFFLSFFLSFLSRFYVSTLGLNFDLQFCTWALFIFYLFSYHYSGYPREATSYPVYEDNRSERSGGSYDRGGYERGGYRGRPRYDNYAGRGGRWVLWL